MGNGSRTLLSLLLALVAASCDGDSSSGSDPGLEFLGLRAEEIGPRRAVIRFDTSRPTTCEAEFGASPDVLDRSATDPSMGPELFALDHEIPLEELAPATTYHYRARAEDESGRVYLSALQSFTTLPDSAASLVDFATLSRGASIVAVSSNFGGAANHETWGADWAIDGLMGTEWASDGDGDDAWVDIDLGVERPVQRVELRSRAMPDGTSIVTSFELRLPDGRQLGPFDTPDPDVVYGFDLDGVPTMQRVVLDVVSSTGGNTGVREIRLLGTAP
jgi:hypothetical protein